MGENNKRTNKEIREPFEPEDTPQPPQIIEPNTRREREKPGEDKKRGDKPQDEQQDEQAGKHHLLGDNADIDDETTI